MQYCQAEANKIRVNLKTTFEHMSSEFIKYVKLQYKCTNSSLAYRNPYVLNCCASGRFYICFSNQKISYETVCMDVMCRGCHE